MAPREKWDDRICCWMGLTRNCETCGERSWSQERVVSHRWMTTMRMLWVVLYMGMRSGGEGGLAQVCKHASKQASKQYSKK